MNRDCILAIDQGTTGTTVMVFGPQGQVLSRVTREFPQHFPQPGWVEHDAEDIWQSVVQLMPQALAAAARKPAQVCALGITNQRETVVCWERASGRPLARAIVWQDRRGTETCARLKAQNLEPLFQQRTGLLLDPYFSGTKMRWLLKETPGLAARAARGEVCFGTMDSWLVWKLSAGAAHVTDVSNASRTLLCDIHKGAWDDELLQILEVPQACLPRIVPSSGICARTAADILDGAALPIAGMAGDQQAALFGQACFEAGQAKCTFGTGAFLLLHTGERPVPSNQRLLTTVAWQLGQAPLQYALEGSVFVAGAAIQWLRDGLGLIHDAGEAEALARSVPSTEGVVFVPALTGLGAPLWDPHARGLICGITRGTTRAHLVRAALEGIAHQVHDVARAMEQDAGLPPADLRADGGASANGFLMQLLSDLLGIPVAVPQVMDTTAFGAACLAGLAVGLYPSTQDLAARWHPNQRYLPSMDASQREQLCAAWSRALERARTGIGPGVTSPA